MIIVIDIHLQDIMIFLMNSSLDNPLAQAKSNDIIYIL
jgi:hypothetical protein